MKKVTFIHAADLHLDSPMTGLSQLPKKIFERIKESTFTALRKLTDAAIEHKVDFVILAGDLFDEEDRSVRAQTRLRKEMMRLSEHQIEVYVVYGNHDHLNGKWIHLDLPENVHIFKDEVEIKIFRKEDTSAHLYGFSYPVRHVTENRMAEYVKQEGADFDIGILHGYGGGAGEHARYAPFQIKDLLAKKFDYWALGHIHKRELLNEMPYIVYPGNIQGRNKKESGSKGCYLVTLTAGETKLEFIETSDVLWEECMIDSREVHSFQDLYLLCLQEMEKKRSFTKGVLLTLRLSSIRLAEKELAAVINGELLQALQEEESEEEGFVWPVAIEVGQSLQWNREELEQESDFYQELFRTFDANNHVTESTRILYENPAARRFLPEMTEEEKRTLQEQALQTLIQLLQHD
ncbi:metallophosphoesterase family protein [Bacillus benzoevorans]|uniref:DNA repair exonuclease SbcCD nuclease subunit n=1 Tax=Bacillus benzoevorans TaxID=1456 RepID=A0A7X0HPN2_9BACI|nr:DNA repair exonuclease [Bacillus benzoevorans]MBB6443462.1 DNA repair exonuclease SbcCD nuclease subunit [Bacillus benzoevorans]